jgi:4-amino-4-deoxy-L-arabinose transferase-like glycosyltransferase
MYYLLASLAFKLTNGSLVALRLFSVLIGAGVVLGAYAVGKALLPTQPQIALGAAAIVAFVPQHVAMLAAVNNDGLAELVVALALWLTIRYLKTQDVKTWQLGVLVGIGLLTKLSTIFLIGLIPFAILLKWWLQRREKPFPLRALVAFALPVLILGGIWWARNISIYGFPDVFGLGRHNLVVADQARTTDEIARVGFSQYLTNSLELTFNSFWGQFGWMAFPLQSWIYALISVFLLLAAVGWLLGFRYRLPAEPNRMAQRAAWLVLCLTALAAVAQYIYYNLEFLQLQGRYMYPGLISFGIGLALGFDGWRRLLRVEHGLRIYAGVAVILLLIPLDLYLIWRVIPGLAP